MVWGGLYLRVSYPSAGAVPVAVLAAAELLGYHLILKEANESEAQMEKATCKVGDPRYDVGVHVLKNTPKTQQVRLELVDMKSKEDDGGELVVKKVAGVNIAIRFLFACATYDGNVSKISHHLLFGASPVQMVEVEEWIDIACDKIVSGATLREMCEALDSFLVTRTYFVGHKMTLADLAVFGALCAAPQFDGFRKAGSFVNLIRWYTLMQSSNLIQSIIKKFGLGLGRGQTPLSASAKADSNGDNIKTGRKGGKVESGSFAVKLKDAEMGKVVTRFPPEPSGYLHIGHAKAALMNEYFARSYDGKLIVRFDDTNPSKEKDEFVENILNDIATLGIKYDRLTYTSDYFEDLLKLGEDLIRNGHMYVDNTPVDKMREERLAKKESASRNSSTDENLRRWKEMIVASEEGQSCAARMKMDMSSDNGCLRDPVTFRCNLDPHHRTGTKYKCYPTYDFACPYVDSIEGVTHALRSAEYNDREPQFAWMQKIMGVRKVHIWEYSRLNFVYTVLSKRKLQWFVNEGIVDGWNDPRFPTVQGIMRRGLKLEALRDFIISQGASRNLNLMEWDKIWAMNKKIIDPVCPRHTSVIVKDRVIITLDNGPERPEVVAIAKHKKYAPAGMKALVRTKQIWIEQVDAACIAEGEEVTLMDWGNAIMQSIERDSQGNVTSIRGLLHLEGDFKKTKLKLTWLPVTDDLVSLKLTEFGYIITKPKPEEDDSISDIVNKDSKVENMAVGDMNMRSLREGDIIQLERKGYYRVDQPFIRHSKPAILFKIPDGKQEKQKS